MQALRNARLPRLFPAGGVSLALLLSGLAPCTAPAQQPAESAHAMHGGMNDGKTPFSPLRSSPALPPSMGEERARRYGVEEVARQAYASTRTVQATRSERRLPRQFHGPLARAQKATRERLVVASGTAEINEDTLFDEIVTQSGLVQRLYTFPGQFMEKGQPILSIFSPERINAQHMFLADFSNDAGNQTRLKYYSSFGSAEQYLKQSESNLRWWGFTEHEVKQLLERSVVRPEYVVASPRSGYVVAMPKSTGDVLVAGGRDEENFVLPGDTVLHGADLRSTWAMLFVDPADFRLFSLGDVVDVVAGEGDARRAVKGVVVHKHEYASGSTRRADFHVILDNQHGTLRPGTFVGLERRQAVSGIWIPATAVLHLPDGACVIRRDPKGFALQPVAADFEVDGHVRIARGLQEGDMVLAHPRSEIDPDAQTSWLANWY